MTNTNKAEFKIILYVFFVISLFFINSLPAYLVLFAVLCPLLLKVPMKNLKAGWVPITLFLFFTFVSNLIGRPGRIVMTAGPLAFTEEGFQLASLRTLRILYMIAGVKVLMASAGTEDIVSALGRLLGPLERLGVPVKDFFLTMGLTIKCFPVLKNMTVEKYRENLNGARDTGFMGRARMISTFLLPMFVKSVREPGAFFRDETKGKAPSHPIDKG